MYVLSTILSIAGLGAVLQPKIDDPFPPAIAADVGLDQACLDAIVNEVRGWVEQERVVGASLLLIKDRRTVLSGAWGWSDIERERPMTIDTICNIRSMTKPLTGMAAQILIEGGAMDLGGLAAESLDGFQTEHYDRITIEHLLTHRSGLALTAVDGALSQYASLRAMAEAASTKPMVAAVGQRFYYSDAGTEVVGALVEAASGKQLGAFITESILEPIGMVDTFHDLDRDDPRRRRMASGYAGVQGNWAPFWSPESGPMYTFAWGSQSLYSTPLDYARFLACWLDLGLNSSGERVFSEAAVRRALTHRSAMTATGTDIPYPCGFFGLEARYGQMAMLWGERGDSFEARDSDSRPAWTFPTVVGHGGSDGTMAWAFPEEDLIVLCFTQSRGQALVLELEPLLQRLVDPDSVVEFPEGWLDYLGSYVANFGPFRNAEITVIDQNGRLAVELAGRGVYTLAAPLEKGGHWIAIGLPMFEFSFVRERAGGQSLAVHTRGQAFVCPKGEATSEPELDLDLVRDLLGTYRAGSNGEDVRVLIQEARLAVEIPGVEGFHALAPGADPLTWHLRAAPSVRLRFERGSDGAILSYTVTGTGRPPVVRLRVDAEGR